MATGCLTRGAAAWFAQRAVLRLASKPDSTDDSGAQEVRVEFLNLVIMFVAAVLALRRPEKERLAFGLLVTSVVLMVVLFSIATRTSLLPGINY